MRVTRCQSISLPNKWWNNHPQERKLFSTKATVPSKLLRLVAFQFSHLVYFGSNSLGLNHKWKRDGARLWTWSITSWFQLCHMQGLMLAFCFYEWKESTLFCLENTTGKELIGASWLLRTRIGFDSKSGRTKRFEKPKSTDWHSRYITDKFYLWPKKLSRRTRA